MTSVTYLLGMVETFKVVVRLRSALARNISLRIALVAFPISSSSFAEDHKTHS